MFPAYRKYDVWVPPRSTDSLIMNVETLEIDGTDLIWSPVIFDPDSSYQWDFAFNDGDKTNDWLHAGYYPAPGLYINGDDIHDFPFFKVHIRNPYSGPYLNIRFYVLNDPRVIWELEELNR